MNFYKFHDFYKNKRVDLIPPTTVFCTRSIITKIPQRIFSQSKRIDWRSRWRLKCMLKVWWLISGPIDDQRKLVKIIVCVYFSKPSIKTQKRYLLFIDVFEIIILRTGLRLSTRLVSRHTSKIPINYFDCFWLLKNYFTAKRLLKMAKEEMLIVIVGTRNGQRRRNSFMKMEKKQGEPNG